MRFIYIFLYILIKTAYLQLLKSCLSDHFSHWVYQLSYVKTKVMSYFVNNSAIESVIGNRQIIYYDNKKLLVNGLTSNLQVLVPRYNMAKIDGKRKL